MARNSRRSGRGSGRGNRGGMYASPIVEPSNFLEEDFSINLLPNADASALTAQISFDQILATLPTSSVGRFRISSVVFDPPTFILNADAGNTAVMGALQLEVVNYGGVHYEQNVTTRPLKVRCANKYGNVGQWIRTNGGALCPENSLPVPGTTPGTIAAFVMSVRAVANATSSARLELHVRIAWDDLDAV